MKRLKNKRMLLVIGVFFAAIAIAGTIAYNQDSMFFQNLFHLGSDVAEFSESFESPDDWMPCQEIPKTATATNKNATPRYVRMKLNEYWRTKNSETSESDHETTDLPLTWNDNGTVKNYAVINTQNDDKWELRSDGWYYYKTPLNQDETTDSLLKSVTMNCDANVAGGVSYSQDGHTATNIESDYSGATYHLYVTFQMSGEEWEVAEEPQYQADCDSNLLYDTIACQTNGLDSNVDFTAAAVRRGSNGYGVNTHTAEAEEHYPVYYYRGKINDNYVVWRNSCWQILRTTTTGGVKMIYYGESRSGMCANSSYAGYSKFIDAQKANSLAHVGYMYGDIYEAISSIDAFDQDYSHGVLVANDVSWDENERRYSLIDTLHETVDSQDEVLENHHYTCGDWYMDECETVYYYIEKSSTSKFVIRLTNGEKIEDAKGKMLANNNDSLLKRNVENWFETNFASYEDDLEDTIFCNDRGIYYGLLKSKDDFGESNIAGYYPNQISSYVLNNSFSVRKRVDTEEGVNLPELMCVDKNDAFTKDDVINGNGKLKYKVGLITADEFVLAGIGNGFLYQSGRAIWTMSPRNYGEGGYTATLFSIYQGELLTEYLTNENGCRPVVSLKSGAKYTSGGNGTLLNPYVIEQD